MAAKRRRIGPYEYPLKDEDIEKVLRNCGGYQHVAAKQLGVSPSWLSTRISKSEKLTQLKFDLMEERIDTYEIALDDLMAKRDTTAIIFFLKTMGKKRGYSQDVFTENNLSAIKAFLDMQRS